MRTPKPWGLPTQPVTRALLSASGVSDEMIRTQLRSGRLVRLRQGTLYPDFLWPDVMLVGECDGAVKYMDGRSIVEEKQREQVLRDLGYRIVRWLAREIMTRPGLVVARIERALLSATP